MNVAQRGSKGLRISGVQVPVHGSNRASDLGGDLAIVRSAACNVYSSTQIVSPALFPQHWPARRLSAGASPASGQGLSEVSPARSANEPPTYRQPAAASVSASQRHSPRLKDAPVERKSVPLTGVKTAGLDEGELIEVGIGVRQHRRSRRHHSSWRVRQTVGSIPLL